MWSKTIYCLSLRATLSTERSFCGSLVSSQLGGVASGGLRVEMGSGWLTRSIQGLCYQKHLAISTVISNNRDYRHVSGKPHLWLHSLFLLCFWSPPNSEEQIWLFSCLMLHLVNQLVANFACLLFVAEQVVYSQSVKLFHWKRLPAAAKNNAVIAVRVNPNNQTATGNSLYTI